MNYFEDHIGDYAAATAHLSWDEDMAYTRLIRAYYHNERPIPKGQAHRLARATTPAQRSAVDSVIAEFFVLQEGGYHQKRCDRELARYRDKQLKAKRSADARWDPLRHQSDRNANALPTQSDRNANALPTHCEGNALQTPDPDSIHQTQKKKGRAAGAAALARPPDVCHQIWTDWVQLRRTKRATVTLTVLEHAQREATKAGLTLEAFLRAWVARGSQGFEAAWLNSPGRADVRTTEPAWRREQRERTASAVPGIVSRPRADLTIIDVRARHVVAAVLG